MKEKPIIFSKKMVEALLSGRKTETRRVIKNTPNMLLEGYDTMKHIMGAGKKSPIQMLKNEYGITCPYGQKEDILYVRENWKPYSWNENGDDWTIQYQSMDTVQVGNLYEDNQKEKDFYIKLTDLLNEKNCPKVGDLFEEPSKLLSWRPSIHLPKRASRIWLQVKEVKVKKLQDITTTDIIAEGIQIPVVSRGNNAIIPLTDPHFPLDMIDLKDFKTDDYFRAFWVQLWDSINANRTDKEGNQLNYNWKSNPWVWVIKYETLSTTGQPIN